MGARKSTSAKGSVSEPTTPKKKLMDSLKKQDLSVDPLLLKPHQKQQLTLAWKHISRDNIGKMIFSKMMSKCPEIKKVFQEYAAQNGHMMGCGVIKMKSEQQHVVHIGELLDMIIKNLNKSQLIDAKCREFGAAHSTLVLYGMKKDYWDIFGEALTESSREWQGLCRHRELLRAWTMLGSFIVDRMREGYEMGLRNRRRSADGIAGTTLKKERSLENVLQNVVRTDSFEVAVSESPKHRPLLQVPYEVPRMHSMSGVQRSNPNSPFHGSSLPRAKSICIP